MKKIFLISILTAAIGCSIFVACKKHEFQKRDDAPYLDDSYDYEAAISATGSANQGKVTNAGARLGRALFYDTKLSKNNAVACASCHKQDLAFADNVAFSSGFDGGKTGRNSMSIINALDAKGFFWDNRTQDLNDMVLQPIRHQIEMGLESSDFLITKLKATSYYPMLFHDAFGSTEITKELVGKAMAQFIFSMVTGNTKADQANVIIGGWNTNSSILTPDERQGSAIFQNKGCAGCHAGNNLRGWNDLSFANIGLDYDYPDKGMGALTADASQNGVFKIPSLRNVALTAPYMHDGRYATLEQVVEHYNSGIIYNPTLSPQLKKMDPITYQPMNEAVKMNMSDDDKRCLVAFLKTLTDYALITDPKFSDPFKK
ncbi:MAG: cytochrome-c peroxidase [Bacteroidetes bacterium]|jgi:cytochrome c peroxidase|nr:cytochrome-c peroxidase [Bacteroidota bacterium]MDF2451483.1 cytochrome-c peroxidase [Bacteroidota bacterium]